MSTVCALKDCDKPGTHLCKQCGEARYCGRDHQVEDWQNHKSQCKLSVNTLSVTQLKNVMKAKVKSYTVDKKNVALGQMDKIIEKDKLVKFVESHVRPEEVEGLLSEYTTQLKSSSSAPNKKHRDAINAALSGESSAASAYAAGMPSREQILKQAGEMRKNPDAVRRSNPEFKNKTNKEIFDLADEHERVAKNPVLFEQAMKHQMEMQKDPNKAKELMKMRDEMMKDPVKAKEYKRMQDEMMKDPKKAEEMMKMQSEFTKDPSTMKNMDLLREGLEDSTKRTDEWIKKMINMIKNNPGMIKNMAKMQQSSGNKEQQFSPEQIESVIDYVCGMSDWVLFTVAKTINWGVEKWPTIHAAYTKFDAMILGCGKYILMLLFCIVMYYSMRVFWWAIMLVFSVLQSGYRLMMGTSSNTNAGIGSSPSNLGDGGTSLEGGAVGGGAVLDFPNEEFFEPDQPFQGGDEFDF